MVIGYGPTGRTVVRLLRDNEVTPTVVELNLDTLRELKLRGECVAVLLADHRMPEMSGLEFLERDPLLRPVRGVFVAQQIKPQARVLAAQREIACVEVDYDVLRGIEPDALRLF